MVLPSGKNTYAGIIVAALPVILGLFGVSLTPSFAEQFPLLLEEAITIAGLLYAFWGRAKAQTPGWLAG